jgi:hypothetical protein
VTKQPLVEIIWQEKVVTRTKGNIEQPGKRSDQLPITMKPHQARKISHKMAET